MTEIRNLDDQNEIHEAINKIRTALAGDIGEAGATEAINEVLVRLGDQARLDSGRQLFLVQGRAYDDENDCSEVIEAASADEAIDDLREDLATGTLGFDSLDAYDKAKQAGQLSTEQEIIIIGVNPVLGGTEDQPGTASRGAGA